MKDRVRQEIIDLHEFFQAWFVGSAEQTDEAFSRVGRSLAEEFELVAPDGEVVPRRRIMSSIQRGFGRRPDFRIHIENFDARVSEGGLCLVTYHEIQEQEEVTTRRVSSAVFRDAPEAPNGVRWLHVHETWV